MMRSVWPWIFLLLAWSVLASFVCKSCFCSFLGHEECGVQVVEEPKKMGLGAWKYNDGGNHKITCPEHIQFLKSSFQTLEPFSSDLDGCIGQTLNYLKDNADRSIEVKGYYKESENNSSILANLGLARANRVKDVLIAKGLAAAQIKLSSELIPEDSWIAGDTILKGVDFNFTEATVPTNRLEEIKNRLLGKPLTLYFATDQSDLNLSQQQRTDFADMIYYLDNVPSSKIEIAGHTDNVGDRSYNINLSKERAVFVQNYLGKNGGIASSRSATSGFGPDKPVTTNASDAGRGKNRRVEVTLK